MEMLTLHASVAMVPDILLLTESNKHVEVAVATTLTWTPDMESTLTMPKILAMDRTSAPISEPELSEPSPTAEAAQELAIVWPDTVDRKPVMTVLEDLELAQDATTPDSN